MRDAHPPSRRLLRLVALAALVLVACASVAVAQNAQPPTDGGTSQEGATTSDASKPTAAGAVARERQQLMARLERLREEADALRSRAADLGEDLVGMEGDEAKLRERRAATAQEVAALEQRVADDEEALEALTDGQAAIRRRLAGTRTELATVLMALQRIGRRPPPALFGDTGAPTDTVRGAILLNGVLPALDAEARELVATLAQAARMEADERARWERLRADLDALAVERRRLDALGAELARRRSLSLYEQEQAGADLARLAEEEGTVTALLERLTDEAAVEASVPEGPPFTSRRGTLAAPVAGRIVSLFGEPTAEGGLAQGRAIAAPPRSTVFAPMHATVLFSAPFRGYGHLLILDAGEGYHMVFAGMQDASVVPGDRVEAGTPLGRMGQSPQRSAVASVGAEGSALVGARPVLYVELRREGAAVDSRGWWQDAPTDVGRTGG
ncbi:murein hydrolase activator EnvC family protein [Acuticoccus sp.]|uniref:murein hydrolase activator EnvC family protein n=1 Tax=Acuticoccus sp. TaxID=1904378 RepID=UPI003B524C4F